MSDMMFTNLVKKGQKFMKKKNLAFTLAEVLIVIGIIGVVAALTLPNLNHATGDKETVTRVKKAYSTLSDAFDRAQVIYGNFDTWFKDFTEDDYYGRCERMAKRITEFMKVSKDCGISDLENCKVSSSISGNGYTVGLSDGMFLSFINSVSIGNNGFITVDINGPNKGKNEDAKDIFCFDIKDNQLYPGGGYGNVPNASDDSLASQCLNLNYCTEWVVTIGNLDYLKTHTVNERHCNGGKCSTDTKHKCPNGVELSWTNNTCN